MKSVKLRSIRIDELGYVDYKSTYGSFCFINNKAELKKIKRGLEYFLAIVKRGLNG